MDRYDPVEDARNQLRQVRSQFQQFRAPLIFAIVVLLLGGGIMTSYQEIDRDEVGVLLRFGKHSTPNLRPGLHLVLPFGIDEVYKVPVERQMKMEFGFRTVSAGIESEFSRGRQAIAEAKMVSGLRNVAIVEWIIQYKIDNPEKYLFHFRDIDITLRLMAEASMRAVIGDYTIDELITGGREEIERAARKRLQDLNAVYDTGITIQQLKLQDANVPDKVKPSLREVEEAKQEKSRMINEAETARNAVIPEARGKAKELIAGAEGYAVARINTAEGDAARFKALYTEYRKSPEVTRTRLYLEAMGEILPKVKRKVLIDKNAKSLVPLLNLEGGSK